MQVDFKYTLKDRVYHENNDIYGNVIGLHYDRSAVRYAFIEYKTEGGVLQVHIVPEDELKLVE